MTGSVGKCKGCGDYVGLEHQHDCPGGDEFSFDEEGRGKLEFESHGVWVEGNRCVSRMWKHTPTGDMYYQNAPEVRERGLPIYPFA